MLHCINKQEPIYSGTMFSYIGHMQSLRKFEPGSYDCFEVLRPPTFQNCTVVLYLHAMVVSKLYRVNLSQGKFKEKRNKFTFLTSENFYSNINFSHQRIFSLKFILHNLLKSLLSRTLYANVLPLFLLW